MSLTTTYLPFQTPIIKNAKVVKLELNPFLQNIISHYTQPLPFENEPHTIKTIPLIREHLTHTFSILDSFNNHRRIPNFSNLLSSTKT